MRRWWLFLMMTALSALPALSDGLQPCHPVVVRQPAPRWPRPLGKLKSSKVVVNYTINLDGAVESIEVKQSSGSKLVDQAARDAVRQYRFEPLSLECGKLDTSAAFDVNAGT
jgi:protein TonB